MVFLPCGLSLSFEPLCGSFYHLQFAAIYLFICGFGRPFTFALWALYHLAPAHYHLASAPYQLASALYQLASAPLSIGSGPFTIWLRPFITNHLAALSAPLFHLPFGPLYHLAPAPFLFPGHRPPLLASALYHSAVALAEHSVGFPPSSPLASGTLTGPFPLAVTFSSRASQRLFSLSVCSIEFSFASPGALFSVWVPPPAPTATYIHV